MGNWSPLKKDQSPRERFDIAWNDLFNSEPFFGATMFSLEIVESEQFPTMATDGKRILYNPNYVIDLTLKEITAVELHEMLHVVYLHPVISAEMKLELSDKYNHFRFNMAADYEINWIIKDMGYKLPEDTLYEKEFHGLMLREIYFKLEAQDDKKGENNGDVDDTGNGDSNSTNSQPSIASDSSEKEGEFDGDSGDNSTSSDDSSSGNSDNNSSGHCGAGISPNWSIAGEVITPTNADGSALTKEQVSEMRNELEKEQIVAASFAKKQGTGNSQVIDDILRRYIARDINWKDRLAEFLTEEIPLGDNWKRPEKRFHSQGYIIPTSEIDYRIRIAILNDLSGSVSDHLAKLWEDVINQNAAQWSDLEVLIINFDDQVVGDTIHLEKEDFPFHLKRASRGGTDYKPPFAALECEDFDPDVIFVLTDLICDSFPDISPIAPVIWCEACDSAWRRHQEMPPFGEIIRIRD